eukprot:2432991-Prymnesium_polylepis.1
MDLTAAHSLSSSAEVRLPTPFGGRCCGSGLRAFGPAAAAAAGGASTAFAAFCCFRSCSWLLRSKMACSVLKSGPPGVSSGWPTMQIGNVERPLTGTNSWVSGLCRPSGSCTMMTGCFALPTARRAMLPAWPGANLMMSFC